MGILNKSFLRARALVAIWRMLECATRARRHMLASWASETAENFAALGRVKFVTPLVCESSLAYEVLQARGFSHSESHKGLMDSGEFFGVIQFREEVSSETGSHLHIVGADADDIGPLKGTIERALVEARNLRADGKRALARLGTVLGAPGTDYKLRCSLSDFTAVTGIVGDIGSDPGQAHFAAERYPDAVDELLRFLMPALAKRMEAMSQK